jgi:hypothetical protein
MIKFGFGKRRTRTGTGKRRREAQRRQRASVNTISDHSRLKAALLCGKAGLPVVPLYGVKNGLCTCGEACDQRGRHPRTENGLKDATTDPKKIKKMWARWPKAKIAIALSPKLTAVVVEGTAGRKELKKLESTK